MITTSVTRRGLAYSCSIAALAVALPVPSEGGLDEEILSRAEAEAQHPDLVWNLGQLAGYGEDEAQTKLHADLKTLQGLGPQLASYQGRLGESAATLLEFFRLQEKVIVLAAGLQAYTFCLTTVDQTNARSLELDQKVGKVVPLIDSALSFYEGEIVKIGRATLEAWMAQSDELKVYAHQFDIILGAEKHILSPETESVLSLGGEFMNLPDRTRGHLGEQELGLGKIDVDGKKVPLTMANFVNFLRNPNREVRKSAFEGVYDALVSKRLTFADIYSGAVTRNVWKARARHYGDVAPVGDLTLTMALANNKIPTAMYDGLIATVETEGLPLLTKYLELRKKILGHELQWHDLYLPLFKSAGKKYTPAQAKDILLAALAPLGEEYLGYVEEFFEKHRIDFIINAGKDSGAYLMNATGLLPFLFMNWDGSLEQLFTLAHEIGHGVHHKKYSKSQPLVYASCATETAETASISNEHLLARYLLKTESDAQVQLQIIQHMVEEIRTTLFRQTMFASFERKAHTLAEQGGALTADKLCEIHLDLNRLYYERQGVCAIDPRIGMEWARIPHFYRSTPFYVYTYSMGTVNGTSLMAQLDKDPEGAITRHLQFLDAGTSGYPLDLLRIDGIDWADPAARVRETLVVFGQYVDLLAKAYDEQLTRDAITL
jgi:oligoendopeptidase F